VWNRVFWSDVFIWLDSVKFSRAAIKWDDRALIESSDGRPIVLRLPLCGSRLALWSEARINEGWRKHLVTITQCYSKRRYWTTVKPMIESVYDEDAYTIDEVCWRTLTGAASILKPTCRFIRSTSLGIRSAKGDLVFDLVRAVGGTSYLTGAPGTGYLPLDKFAEAGIEIAVQEWRAPVTRHGLANPSIIDLLANVGPDAAREVLSGPPSNATSG
jgi:WbqC-like protein family